MRSAEDTEATAGLDPETLLGDDHETFTGVTSGERAGPLAVVAAPFAGRQTVVAAAADRLGVEAVSLSADRASVPQVPAEGPVVVDGCHHLYRRAVGGFDRLDEFLNRLAAAEGPVVTGWNRYAWTYLAAVRGLDRAFADRVDVGPVAAEAIAEVVLSRYGDLPSFAADESMSRERRVRFRRRRISVGGYGLEVPVPTLRPPAGEVAPADVVFERLAAVTEGNVGAATAIWTSARSEEMRPSDVVGAGTDPTLDREEAFCLRLVLAKGRVARSELEAVIGEGVDRVVGRLVRAGLLVHEGAFVTLEPAALPTATAAADRRPIL
ncbi:hypothetical protein [Halosegnis sp.]|uniref:hypothetical protein n=1 Tax=Halosegnis sp. TaxID=2864959 RepID=UPI0035D517D8